MQKVDAELHMFIQSVCNYCGDSVCEGALSATARGNCAKYAAWMHMPDDNKVKIFAESLKNEFDLLEDIVL